MLISWAIFRKLTKSCSYNLKQKPSKTMFDAIEAYDDFIQKIMVAIDLVAPIKERRIKPNSREWFDGEIYEAIKNRDKLLKIFLKI